MRRETLINHHVSVCGCARDLMIKKNQDYASSSDAFGNLDLVESVSHGDMSTEQGIIVRLADKLSRAWTLTKQPPAVASESLDDTILDIINYAVLLSAKLYDRRVPGNTQVLVAPPSDPRVLNTLVAEAQAMGQYDTQGPTGRGP